MQHKRCMIVLMSKASRAFPLAKLPTSRCDSLDQKPFTVAFKKARRARLPLSASLGKRNVGKRDTEIERGHTTVKCDSILWHDLSQRECVEKVIKCTRQG